MFDLDFGKLVVIGIIALIAIGPKELPAVLRTVGQYMAKVRRMAAEFQGQFQEAMREAEMADMKKHVDEIHEAARGLTSSFDPLSPTQTQTTAAAEHKPAAAEPAGNAPVEVAVSPPEPEAAVTAQDVVAAQPDLAGVAETPRPADAPEPRDRPA